MVLKSLVVDEAELLKFIRWLPPLAENEAYLAVLMIRSTGLREKYGFKGSDHKLSSRAIHGYLSEILPPVEPFDEPAEHWRLRLYSAIHRLAAEALYAQWFYVKYRPGTREPEAVYMVPPELMGLMVTINPLDITKAVNDTMKDVIEAAWSAARGARLADVFRRPDERYHANLMKHMKTRFHVVDVDDQELFKRVMEMLKEELGYQPAYITTSRGGHILVDLHKLKELGTIRRWVGKATPNKQGAAMSYYVGRCRIRESREELERKKRELDDYIWHGKDPLYHRLVAASKVYLNERCGSLIEVKKKTLEPVPGTWYKGVVVRFTPERG